MSKDNNSKKSQGLSIGAVSSITGVPQPTLRYWERLGLLEPLRSEGGHRFYDQKMVPLIEQLKKSTGAQGMKAKDLATIQDSSSPLIPLPSLPSPEGVPAVGMDVNRILIEEEVDGRMRGRSPAAAAFIELEGGTALREQYGLLGWRKVLQLVAFLIHDTLRDYGGPEDAAMFLGQDDFLVLTTPSRLENLTPRLKERFRQFLVLQFGRGEGNIPAGPVPNLSLRVSAADNQSEVFLAAVEGKRLTLPLLKEWALKAAR